MTDADVVLGILMGLVLYWNYKKIRHAGVYGLNGFGQHCMTAAVLQQNQEADTRVRSESYFDVFVEKNVTRRVCIEPYHDSTSQ